MVPGLVCGGCGRDGLSVSWMSCAVPEAAPEAPGARGRPPVRVVVTVRVSGYCLACRAWTCGTVTGARVGLEGFRGGTFIPDHGAPAAA